MRTISLFGTRFVACLLPALPVLMGGALAIDTVRQHGMSAFSSGEILLPSLFAAFGAAYFWVIGQSYKAVAIDGDKLVIASCLHSAEVPLTEIDTVREIGYLSRRQIQIWFRRQTEFGIKVEFVPQFAGFGPHPIVAELEELAGLTPPRPAPVPQ